MSIILIRHGETELNVARILQPPETPLSSRGQQQAQAVAARIAAMKIGCLISSDLTRAMQTATAIASAARLPISYSSLLQERNFGDLRGCAYDGFDYDPIAMEDAPPGGESLVTLRARVVRALALVCKSHADGNGDVAVVTHGFFIRTMVEHCLALPGELGSSHRISNTSLTIFSAQPPHRIEVINDCSHLTADLSDDVRSLSGS
jgi:broad specificity phosphatase PhoE